MRRRPRRGRCRRPRPVRHRRGGRAPGRRARRRARCLPRAAPARGASGRVRRGASVDRLTTPHPDRPRVAHGILVGSASRRRATDLRGAAPPGYDRRIEFESNVSTPVAARTADSQGIQGVYSHRRYQTMAARAALRRAPSSRKDLLRLLDLLPCLRREGIAVHVLVRPDVRVDVGVVEEVELDLSDHPP